MKRVFKSKLRKALFFQMLILLMLVFDSKSQGYKQVIDKQGVNKTERGRAAVVLRGESFTRCSTVEADAFLRSKYPSMPKSEVIENELQRRISLYKKQIENSRTTATIYTIPVIVHVVHNGEAVGNGTNITEAQVKSQLDVLNEDFRRKSGTPGHNTNPVGADIEVQFALAVIDPTGKILPEPGINRIKGVRSSWDYNDLESLLKPATQWDPTQYLNMWVVKFGGDMSSTLGYAQFPVLSGLPGMDDKNAGLADTDGLVMSYQAFGRTGNVIAPYDKGRTTTHEIGHWLGLRHVWGDESDCIGTDYCRDTPTTSGPNYGCNSNTNSCTDAGNDMIENYMDYSDDGCMNIFTVDQKNRIRTVMTNSPRRKELINSTVHISDNSGRPYPIFSANETEICRGTSVTFTDGSTNKPTSWNWVITDVNSNTIATSNQQNFTYTFTQPGTFNVALTVANVNGQNEIGKEDYITVLSDAGLSLPFSEDMEGETALEDWSLYNPDNDEREWVFAIDVGAGNSTSSLYFDNYDETTDPSGKEDAIISPAMDLAANQYAEFSFDVAYAMYEDEDGVYSDTLALYYSIDCGKTFTRFWERWGTELATSETTGDSFVPTSIEWRRENVSLAFLNGKKGVIIAVVNISGWGNNIFLDNFNIKVNNPLTPPIAAFEAFKTVACEGESLIFSDRSEKGPISWSWTFEGGTPTISMSQNPSVTYTKPGVYAVTLTATNSYGSDIATKVGYITVKTNPVITITQSRNNICEGDTLTLTAAGGINYFWKDNTRGEVIGRGASLKVRPTKTTRYTVLGANESGCYSLVEREIAVQRNPIPKPTISYYKGTLTSSSETGNQWLLNGNIIPEATGQTYYVTTSGAYSVRVTEGVCFKISNSSAITPTSEDQSMSGSVTIFPNPSPDEIVIKAELTSIQSPKAAIYNSLGVKLEEYMLNKDKDGWKAVVNLYKFAKGTYFIRIVSSKSIVTRTFIKN